MKNIRRRLLFIIAATIISVSGSAQANNTISGNVKNRVNNEIVPAVSILIKGTSIGTYTDNSGNFKIAGNFSFPVTLVFSSVGFAPRDIVVENTSQKVNVVLDPVSELAQEVVVSASRLPQRILESPVSIERVSAATIRNAAAPSYYDLLANLKGVDIVTSSLNFKTPSTRGFNSSGNLRLNQLVEGMDNQSPGLNFAVGAMAGLTELDVENMELLSGASSALYGPGGMNGTLLINSKNPFKYQGLSVQVKQGIMHIADDAAKASPYYDLSFRWGQQVSQKFAFKISGQFIQAKDWVASDYSNYDIGDNPATGKVKPGNRQMDPNYQGVNVYGDETSVDINGPTSRILQGVINASPNHQQLTAILDPYLKSPLPVSRTGYRETDILDPTTKNLKFSGGLYYKITPAIEASLSGNWGSGSTVYTGSDRYSFKDFVMAQYKAEVKHKNWFVRAYTTQENAGKTFNATVTTRLFNESWKPSYNNANPLGSWYPQYSIAFATAAVGAYQTAFSAARSAGQTDAQAAATAQTAMLNNTTTFHTIARNYADQGRPEAGSAEFNQKFDSVASRPISNGGGLFIDKSSLYMTEGQYNFTDLVKVAEVLVGANFKQYVLNSEGTLFPDKDKRIKINETGAYALISKALFNNVLKLTASGRYDKNENFKGRFTPRFSAVITVAKNNNIRLSYQTTYRFPSTQNQWIDLEVQNGARLIGGLTQLRKKYNFDTNPVYTVASVQAFGASARAGTPNPALLQKVSFDDYKPESATSYEVGYKSLIAGKFLFDAYAYYSQYKNFIGRIVVLQSSNGTPSGLFPPNIFSISVNSKEKVNTHGWGASAEYLLPHNFSVNANVYSDEITNVPANFVAQFNTPKYRGNIGVSNSGFLWNKSFGFTVQYKYQDKVYYQGDFAAGTIPAFHTIDAQVNYKFTSIRSMVKLGATNLTNHYYRTAFGNPYIGGLYYVSFAYNVF
ncbi:TonB-dependent receptor [Segetibacter koreensis]|uniref:TonB-dependent receptor n=1 Tax=Segetibacter koreensis TaxID=398037 RepID=UPI00037BC436|nr:TonB-dependent receptor [Segetibacter koreensis]